MNKDYILFNLREAHESLGHIISEFESNPEYAVENYQIDLEHLYDHINTAWNARDASSERTRECTENDFTLWRQFPADLWDD